MTRKLKTLGAALFAVLALASTSAAAASAASYTASSYPTTGTATSVVGNDTFKTEAGTVECAAHYQGTLNASSTSLTVIPTYTNCKAFGFLSATFNLNGCTKLFTTPTGTAPNFTTPFHWICPPGKFPEITAGTCKVTISPQGPLNSIAVTNTGGTSINLQANVSGIAYTVVTDGFGCPFNGTGAKTGATYTQHSAISFASTNGAKLHVG